mgnify:CR=1 FL=1
MPVLLPPLSLPVSLLSHVCPADSFDEGHTFGVIWVQASCGGDEKLAIMRMSEQK